MNTPGVWHYTFTTNMTLCVVEHDHLDDDIRYAVIILTGRRYPTYDRHGDAALVCCCKTRLLAIDTVENILEEARNNTMAE